jgi:hypothetical protein
VTSAETKTWTMSRLCCVICVARCDVNLQSSLRLTVLVTTRCKLLHETSYRYEDMLGIFESIFMLYMHGSVSPWIFNSIQRCMQRLKKGSIALHTIGRVRPAVIYPFLDVLRSDGLTGSGICKHRATAPIPISINRIK